MGCFMPPPTPNPSIPFITENGNASCQSPPLPPALTPFMTMEENGTLDATQTVCLRDAVGLLVRRRHWIFNYILSHRSLDIGRRTCFGSSDKRVSRRLGGRVSDQINSLESSEDF